MVRAFLNVLGRSLGLRRQTADISADRHTQMANKETADCESLQLIWRPLSFVKYVIFVRAHTREARARARTILHTQHSNKKSRS